MVGLDPVLWNFLILRLVPEVFRVVDTLYVPEGIDVWKLLLDIFQQQAGVQGKFQLNYKKLAKKRIQSLEEVH